jgi:8-oxo-dGTP diphosphatase
MTRKEFEKFTISQVAVLIREGKCLILEFSDELGYWGLPGGRVDKGELGEEAFRREMKEEIGLSKFEIIAVVDYDIWHTRTGKPVCGIASLIKNETDKIKLSEEHNQMRWVTKEELSNYKFLWPNAKRMLEKGFEYNKK